MGKGAEGTAIPLAGVEVHQPRRIGDRPRRPEHQRIDGAVDSGIRARAHRQACHNDQRQPACGRDVANSLAEIVLEHGEVLRVVKHLTLFQLDRQHAEGDGLSDRRDLVAGDARDRRAVSARRDERSLVPATTATATAEALGALSRRRRFPAQVPRNPAKPDGLVEIQLADLLAGIVGDVQHQLVVTEDCRLTL